MSPPSVSVVICAFTTRRWERLRMAVQSVRGQSVQPQELIVVIDHCDDLLRIAQDLDEGMRVLPNAGPPGLSGARNTGVAAACGDVVAFLDDDAVAEPDWLRELTSHYRDPDVIGVGGHVAPDWQESQPRWFPPEFGWVVGCSYRGQPAVTAPVRNPIGASMSFRRSPVLLVGGFSCGLGRVGTNPAGCEETELSIRLASSFPRARIMHEPAAVVHHHVPAERSRWRYFRRRCFAEGQSKARVRTLADPRQSLASERTYVSRTLPAGLLRSVRASVERRDPDELASAFAMVAGVTITAAGFATENARRWWLSTKPRQRRNCPTASTRRS